MRQVELVRGRAMEFVTEIVKLPDGFSVGHTGIVFRETADGVNPPR